jgi:UPF0755 protein
VSIAPGSSPAAIAQALADAGVVRSQWTLRTLARLKGVHGRLQAGEYLFDHPMTPEQVLDQLVRGVVLLHRITIPEGIRGAEAIQRIARAGIAPAAALEAAFRDPAPVKDIDPAATDLEGYLYPETYHFARGTSAPRILEEMVGRFKGAWEESLRARAETLGMSARQVVTLASLIEKETGVDSERTRVSAVFHNRLKASMPLQCDPTVIYALVTKGLYRGVLLRDDLDFDSPYNTYAHAGLPPGPIASPGLEALQAAVAPAPVSDLYFVADGSGGHHFSGSLGEHSRAVERYRRLQRSGM